MPTIEEILAFEKRRWNNQGAKTQAILDELGLSAPRYYQLLGRVIDDPAALLIDPQTVNRLRRLRDTRRRAHGLGTQVRVDAR